MKQIEIDDDVCNLMGLPVGDANLLCHALDGEDADHSLQI